MLISCGDFASTSVWLISILLWECADHGITYTSGN